MGWGSSGTNLHRSFSRLLFRFLALHRGHDLDLRQRALFPALRLAVVQDTLAELHGVLR